MVLQPPHRLKQGLQSCPKPLMLRKHRNGCITGKAAAGIHFSATQLPLPGLLITRAGIASLCLLDSGRMTQLMLGCRWEESGYFRPAESSDQKPFVMSM